VRGTACGSSFAYARFLRKSPRASQADCRDIRAHLCSGARGWGRLSEQMLPHLRDVQDRDVHVHAAVLPRDDVNKHLKPLHQILASP
jgi:hypothetical protein